MTPAAWHALLADWRVFALGLEHTLIAAALALVFASLLGLIFGLLGVAPGAPARAVSRVYVEAIRNTPLLLQAFFFYYGLPRVHIVLPVLTVGVVSLSIYTGAFIAEVVRGGIESVARGQLEAAYSQGFSFVQAMRYVILPQALRVILPPYTNQCVNLVKNTQILSLIAGADLVYQADTWSSENLLYGVAYVSVAVLYLAITLPLATLSRWLERRLGRRDVVMSDA
jgi:aspartate/glutamate/glutamine transport system permease protein